MLLDRLFQISGSAVMKEEDALSEPPQRSGPKFSRRCLTLTDAISKPAPHVVTAEVPVRSAGVWHKWTVNVRCLEEVDLDSIPVQRLRCSKLP